MALPIDQAVGPRVTLPSSAARMTKCSTSQIGGAPGVAQTICCHIKPRDGRAVPGISSCAAAAGPILQPTIFSLPRRRLILRQPLGRVGYRAFPSSSGYLRVAGVRACARGPSRTDSAWHPDPDRADAHSGLKEGSEGIVVPDTEPESGVPSVSNSSDPVKTCNVCGCSKLLVDFEKTVSSVDKRTETCRACLAALKATLPGARSTALHLRLTPEEAWERAKICRVCKVTKELRDFTRDANSKDGTSYRCRSCGSKKDSVLALKSPIGTPQQCKQCNEVKPATEYHLNKRSSTGLQNVCKPCYRRRNNDRYLRLRKSTRVFVQRQEKLCSACRKTKPVSEFYKDSAKIDGVLYQCKDCQKAEKQKRRLASSQD
jgi:hypothetical protein